MVEARGTQREQAFDVVVHHPSARRAAAHMAAEAAPDGAEWFRAEEQRKENPPPAAEADEFAELYGADAMYAFAALPLGYWRTLVNASVQ